MARIFKEDPIKTIPKSLDACNKCPIVVYELWHWARFLETSGIVLFVIYIIVGIALSIGFQGDDFCLSIVGGVVLGFMSYAFSKAIALLIGGLAALIYNASISANVAIYESTKKEQESSANSSEESSSGTGTQAEKTDVTTSKGTSQSASSYFNSGSLNTWDCKSCGSRNIGYTKACWNCKSPR